MINRFALLVLLLLAPLSSFANTVRIFTLSADEWAQPRSGSVIIQFSAVRSAISYWEKGIDSAILIRYPGEDSGEIWASELRDWIISLGIPSDYLQLVPGSQAADEIRLIVGQRDELK
ncbi:MAG: hypothetical protein ACI8XX_001067 [Polaribacter sp.]